MVELKPRANLGKIGRYLDRVTIDIIYRALSADDFDQFVNAILIYKMVGGKQALLDEKLNKRSLFDRVILRRFNDIVFAHNWLP